MLAVAFPTPDELRTACERIPGPSVLAVCRETIAQYSCATFSLVERDIVTALSSDAAREVLSVVRRLRVPEALQIREELVNYKKVSLHVHEQGIQLERRLGQLVHFFREEERTAGGYLVHTKRRTELSDAKTRCKGRCESSFDARTMGKHLCCVSRHPAKSRSKPLEDLPHSLRSWRLGVAAEDLLREGMGPNGPERSEALGRNATSRKRSLLIRGHDGSEELLTSIVHRFGFLSTSSSEGSSRLPEASTWHQAAISTINEQDWPDHVKDFVLCVLICRGGDKALRIRDELRRMCSFLRLSLQQAETALAKLREMPTPEETRQRLEAEGRPEDASTDWLLGGVTLYKKHINLLEGCLPLLRENLHWLNAIEGVGDSDCGRLFVAGDGTNRAGCAPPAFNVPVGFGANMPLDDRFDKVLQTYLPQMQQVLKESGWPKHLTECANSKGGGGPPPADKVCRGCGRSSELWVQRGICCECEDSFRSQGRCPFGKKCESSWFCLHAQRCFICDSHSCDACRFSRGGSEEVLSVAAQLRPALIVLDFDRTLATTKSGGMPVVGKHTADEELISLFWRYKESCMVVTRNSHVAEIKDFLVAHGAPENVAVHSIRRPRSKAQEFLPLLGERDIAMIVDDGIAELVDPLVSGDDRVHRMLFLRAML